MNILILNGSPKAGQSNTYAASWTGAVNSILPLLMGVFTGWFRKWYPAKVAAGKIQ